MFDQETARKLRSAPRINGLEPESIPELLTRHYVRLVSHRLGVAADKNGDDWDLGRIADSYEIMALTTGNKEHRRSAAFVAATAQLIIAKSSRDEISPANAIDSVSRDAADPALTACLLFIIAEQFADANEAASHIVINTAQPIEAVMLANRIRELARGRISALTGKPKARARQINLQEELSLEEQALRALILQLAHGIDLLADEILLAKPSPNADQSAHQIFSEVQHYCSAFELEIASTKILLGQYNGPGHIATLLISAGDILLSSSITKLPTPPNCDPTIWGSWLEHRATSFPFFWPNHLDFITQDFHHPGRSAVLVLPTGAGKTTVSTLKIAATIASGRKIIFLAPTHALVEQLTEELQSVFPEHIVGAIVSDEIVIDGEDGDEDNEESRSAAPTIQVMTPEACLASLAYVPARFDEVGLMVFDECHLLATTGSKARRAIDGMLCILAFVKTAPHADLLLLSAMLRNGDELAAWINELTGRDCKAIDTLWKPSRQARGVIIYQEKQLKDSTTNALSIQESINRKRNKKAKDLRERALAALRAVPYAVWGLQHNWLTAANRSTSFFIHPVLSQSVRITGKLQSKGIHLTPNANSVAASIAIEAAKNGLKTIIFVNNKSHAVKTAREISAQLATDLKLNELEQLRYDALAIELGSIKHSLLHNVRSAVPHNASMIRLEREIAERIYRRDDGAKVIVATPTLAQGLNLPAQLAILAGDKRTDEDQHRIELDAHEILNAAARAGRAGHLANGIVLMVPEPVISFLSEKRLPNAAAEKLQALLPEDDRCVVISDPLETVLDKLSLQKADDADVIYVVNRMAALELVDEESNPLSLFDINRSFAAFKAREAGDTEKFRHRVASLAERVSDLVQSDAERVLASLSSRTGLPLTLLGTLRGRLEDLPENLPGSVHEWLSWIITWLKEDPYALHTLLGEVSGSICAATGNKRDTALTSEMLDQIEPAIKLWIEGAPLSNVEHALGGNPYDGNETETMCPRARELTITTLGRGFSYIAIAITMVASTLPFFNDGEVFSRDVVESLHSALKKGYDRPQKVRFAQNHPELLCRVLVHQEFNRQQDEFWSLDD